VCVSYVCACVCACVCAYAACVSRHGWAVARVGREGEGDVPIDDIHPVILLLGNDCCGYLLFIVPRILQSLSNIKFLEMIFLKKKEFPRTYYDLGFVIF